MRKKMQVIPAIDIINGKCVRLTQGVYEDCTTYADDPLEMAMRFEEAGFSRLHLVDLDGAKSSQVVNIDVLKRICEKTSLQVDFSGGIKSDEDMQKVFDSGAAFAGIGSVAQSDREKTESWLEKYGGEKIIIGADVSDGMIAIHGWKTVTDTSLRELISWYEKKIVYLMCTDIARDGMLGGASVNLYNQLEREYPKIKIIASGGIGSLSDVEAVEATGVSAVVIGKAIYENRIKLEELTKWTER